MVTASQPSASLPAPGHPVLIRGIAWDTFQALLRDFESQPGQRLTYDNGHLEIWMPLPPQESYKRWLGRLIEILTEELDIEIRSLSSTTWSREDQLKGVEADECYYIQNEALIRGRMEIDLSVDPPPDLVIEVDITSLSIPRLPIYGSLRIPEIWRFDGQQLTFLQRIQGSYEAAEHSRAFPLLQSAEVQNLLMQALTMGETSWAKLVRRWVQANLLG